MSGRAYPRSPGAALSAGALLALPALAADDDLGPVSRATGGAATGGTWGFPVVCAGGRRVAFGSDAGNLAGDDANGVQDAAARDLVAGATTFVVRGDGVASVGRFSLVTRATAAAHMDGTSSRSWGPAAAAKSTAAA